MKVGQARATPAFALQAKYIIHTVGPAWKDGMHGEREAVRLCYKNCLALARSLGCESIAFPLIATGVYGFPKSDALQIAIRVFRHFLTESDMHITLVVFDEESFVLSGKIFARVDAYIDDNYVEEHLEKEYSHPYPGDSLLRPAWRSMDPEEEALPDEEEYRGRELAGRLGRSGSKRRKGLQDRKDIAKPVGAAASPAWFDEAAPKPAASAASPARSLDDLMAQVGQTWQECLFRLIDEKGYTDTEVYKRANVDRKLFSKIRGNPDYQPKKITAVAFALALRLNLDETTDLLSRAGFALSPSSRFDLIISYFIQQEVYDTYTINLALFNHHQPLLGA